jgi:hypothetical protein
LTSYTLSGGMQVFCYSLHNINGVSRLKVQGRFQALLYDASSKKTLAIAYPGQLLRLSIGHKGRKHQTQQQIWFLPLMAYPLADEKRGINTPLDYFYFIFDGVLLVEKLTIPNTVETALKKAATLALAQPPESLEQVCKLLEPLGLCAWHWPGEKDA